MGTGLWLVVDCSSLLLVLVEMIHFCSWYGILLFHTFDCVLVYQVFLVVGLTLTSSLSKVRFSESCEGCLSTLAETVTDYTNFCVDNIVLMKKIKTFAIITNCG